MKPKHPLCWKWSSDLERSPRKRGNGIRTTVELTVTTMLVESADRHIPQCALTGLRKKWAEVQSGDETAEAVTESLWSRLMVDLLGNRGFRLHTPWGGKAHVKGFEYQSGSVLSLSISIILYCLDNKNIFWQRLQKTNVKRKKSRE